MKRTPSLQHQPEQDNAQLGTKPLSQPPEVIDSEELARRWRVPVTWVRDYTRTRAHDPIPHVRLGKYVRFEWGSPELAQWLARRRSAKLR